MSYSLAQLYLGAINHDEAADEVDAQVAAFEDRIGALHLHPVPQRRPDSGDEFCDAKGLGHIIVGACLERRDLGAFLTPARQNDDWGLVAAAPHFLDDREAVQVRQAEIEQHDLRLLRDDFGALLSAIGIAGMDRLGAL